MQRHKRKINSNCAFKKYRTNNKKNIMATKKEDTSDSDDHIIYRSFYKFNSNIHKQILPITTRGLGFIIRELAFKLHCLSVIPHQHGVYHLTNALYRISLLQLDLKLELALDIACPGNLCNDAFMETKVPASFVPAIENIKIGFAPIIDYINTIGFHKANNVTYIPRHPRLNDATLCSPFYVNFENLRKVVQLMSDAKFQPEERQHFYNHCPIPGARWVFPDSPILINADDIMPKLYGLQQIQEDVYRIINCADYINRKYPTLLSMNGIKWQNPGSISEIIFSNSLAARCPLFDKKRLEPIIVKKNLFCCATENISRDEFYKGVFCLLGEYAPLPLKDPSYLQYRKIEQAKISIWLDFEDLFSELFENYILEV